MNSQTSYHEKITLSGRFDGRNVFSPGPDLGPFGTSRASETGFYAGGFASIGFSDALALQPEILYVALPDDASYLSVPVMGKYTFAQKFSVMAGPAFNYFINADDDQFKVNVDFGAAYEFIEHLEANAKYSVGFGDVAVSGLFVGAAYKF